MTSGDEQDLAEAFDADKLDDDLDEGDALGQLTFPPDRALGANDPTADDRVFDSVASREERLLPDPVEAIGGEDAEFDDVDAADGTVGRLTEPGAEDDGVFPVDDEADAIAADVPEGDLSAEERAMHRDRG